MDDELDRLLRTGARPVPVGDDARALADGAWAQIRRGVAEDAPAPTDRLADRDDLAARRRRRRPARLASITVAVVLAGAGTAAAADYLATRTGEETVGWETDAAGRGELLNPAGTDRAEVFDEVTAGIEFPPGYEASRQYVLDLRPAEADTRVTEGVLRSDAARAAVCSWTDAWVAADDAGDRGRGDRPAGRPGRGGHQLRVLPPGHPGHRRRPRLPAGRCPVTDWFEDLYRETHDGVLGYLARRVPLTDAADLLAETYLVAWRRRDELPPAEGRRPWLFGVARRLLLAHQRQQPVVLPLDGDHACADPAPGSADRGAAVRRALATLGPVDRELVTLTVWDGLTPAEAAAVVGLTAGTARVRLHRARARLARHPELRGSLGLDDEPATGEVVAVPVS